MSSYFFGHPLMFLVVPFRPLSWLWSSSYVLLGHCISHGCPLFVLSCLLMAIIMVVVILFCSQLPPLGHGHGHPLVFLVASSCHGHGHPFLFLVTPLLAIVVSSCVPNYTLPSCGHGHILTSLIAFLLAIVVVVFLHSWLCSS